ncbi:MAG: hypothetical protein K2Q18_19780, partial [Bdellovibrionales bacterium]|nr:hypothetical protein [Bdellovibrionales bacterium]
KLGINPQKQRQFKILKTDFYKTYPGQVFYLVDVSYEELIKNDQSFYQQAYDLKNQFADQKISFQPNKKYELFLTYEAFKQSMDIVTLPGRTKSCTRDRMEAGDCEQCFYKIHTPSSTYEKVSNIELDNLGISIKINENEASLSTLKDKNSKEGLVSITIDNNETLVSNGGMVIIKGAPVGESKLVRGFDQEGSCQYGNSRNFTLEIKVDFQVVLRVSGRGEELRKIVL